MTIREAILRLVRFGNAPDIDEDGSVDAAVDMLGTWLETHRGEVGIITEATDD